MKLWLEYKFKMLENKKWFMKQNVYVPQRLVTVKYCVNVYLGDLRLSLTLDKQRTRFFQYFKINICRNADKQMIN